jgi:hypothetical protein
MVFDEHGIGGSDEYSGENDAQIGRIKVFNHGALGGKCDAGSIVNHTRGKKLDQRPLQKS